MSGHRRIQGFVLAFSIPALLCQSADLTDATDIVRRATVVLQSDWNAIPAYAFIQRDEFLRDGKPASKTHQVVMIAGSDYYIRVAVDDLPLSQAQREAERTKLKEEVRRRQNETSSASEKRVQNYRNQRQQNGRLIAEFPESFNFQLAGEETINGHAAYLLEATPRKRTGSLSPEAKILSGMRGRLWVEKEGFHLGRAEASLSEPVSIFGIFARALPGTRIEFGTAPADASVWLVDHLFMDLKIAKLWFHSTRTTRSVFSNYRPNDQVIGELIP